MKTPRPRLHPPALLAVLAAFAVAGCGERPADAPAPRPAALAKVILQTDWYAQPEHGGFYQAQAKGFYREDPAQILTRPLGSSSFPS